VTKSTPMGSVDAPFNPLAVALGAGATFVARSHDMDRQHMQEMMRRAHAHKGAAFVEIFQNCNVFNDGQFETLTARANRDDMLIPLEHGKAVRFGKDLEKGVVIGSDGAARIVNVADVGEDAIVVHDEKRPEPGLAFMLAQLSQGVHQPTPVGIFRAVERAEYAVTAKAQLVAAEERGGRGDLQKLLHSQPTWTV
jgi:2-oxoglutarate ferredoxin oxidoreductase subunit beta